MKKGVVLEIIVIIAILMIIPAINAINVDPEVTQKISMEEEVSIIVVLKDQPLPERGAGIASANTDEFSRRKEMISEAQDNVLSGLRVRERGKDKISGMMPQPVPRSTILSFRRGWAKWARSRASMEKR